MPSSLRGPGPATGLSENRTASSPACPLARPVAGAGGFAAQAGGALWVLRLAAVAGLAVVGGIGAACSGSVNFSVGGESPAEAAVGLIEGEAMAQRLGIGAITDAVCDDPGVEEVGTVFGCTAISDGKTVEFEVEIEAQDRIFAGPTNVVDRGLLPDYERSAVESLNAANDLSLPVDAMDCGGRSVVLDAQRTMICELTDSESGVVYNAALTVADTATGAFSVEVLDAVS